MARGDHISVRRGVHYSHHGVDCGDGTVIHYVGDRASDRLVARTTHEDFAAGSKVKVRPYAERLGADETISNAESRLGSAGYHLMRNNCEHFAAWSCTGRARSGQVRAWLVGTQGTVASFLAAMSFGLHVATVGTISAGIYALTHPRRRR